MLHLSPESGQWVTCPIGDDDKCEFVYHAPVGEGEITNSLLWETYASEELYRNPTEVRSIRTKVWKNIKGDPHRDYGLPAVEDAKGIRVWYKNGKLHRLDGPAIERASGTKEWYVNGERHREDGPAVEWVDGHKEWHQNGKLHRLDGPAVEYADGRKEWWVNDKQVKHKQNMLLPD